MRGDGTLFTSVLYLVGHYSVLWVTQRWLVGHNKVGWYGWQDGATMWGLDYIGNFYEAMLFADPSVGTKRKIS